MKLVGMDSLSVPDRMKMEAARSIREDFLQQEAFDEIDTHASMRKMLLIMELVLAFYDLGLAATEKGADVEALSALPVREAIGRFKYVPEDQIEEQYREINTRLHREIADLIGKEA